MVQIFKSTDYDKFKFIATNRQVGNCRELKKSILKLDLTAINPILVTPDFEIIDGQNRFKVCKELGKPIYYMIANPKEYGASATEVITTLNQAQKNWHIHDFLASHAKEGYQNYVDYANFCAYHNVPKDYIGVMLMVYTGKKQHYAEIKAKKLFPKWERADELMSIINSLERLPYHYSKNFVCALLSIFKSRTPNEMKKLMRKIDAMPYYGSVSAFTAAMNNLIDSNR